MMMIIITNNKEQNYMFQFIQFKYKMFLFFVSVSLIVDIELLIYCIQIFFFIEKICRENVHPYNQLVVRFQSSQKTQIKNRSQNIHRKT